MLYELERGKLYDFHVRWEQIVNIVEGETADWHFTAGANYIKWLRWMSTDPENPSLPSLWPTPSASQGMSHPRIPYGTEDKHMAFNKATATQLESLYRELLEEAFRGTFTFDPITVESTQNMFDQDALHVTAAYNGDVRLLDPAKLNRISSQMVDEAAELGIENTILESYVDSREYGGQVDRVEEPMQDTGGDQDWRGMLNIARRFLNTETLPNEAELATAVDCCYFAMYHALCHSNAHALAGTPWERRREDWSRVYMGMEENTIVERLRHYRPRASDEVNDFSAAFAILQEHQDRAMEPPTSAFHPSEVIRLIQRDESAITALESLVEDERRSLALNLLVGNVHGKGPNIIAAPDTGRVST